jgi:hypothetical protein
MESIGGLTRRSLLVGIATTRLFANKGTSFPPDTRRYPDPATELEVYRLTDPAYSSTLPAYYNRVITRNSGALLFCCDRAGSPQAFRIDLKTGEEKQLTQVENLDGASLTMTPDNRSFCFFAGNSLYISGFANLRERELYRVQEGWERCAVQASPSDRTALTPPSPNGRTGSRGFAW